MLTTKQIMLLMLGLFSTPLYASFIEATEGSAVVNDATATHFNPAALTLLKNPQLLTLGSFATLHTHFSGETMQNNTNLIQAGSTSTATNYFLPSVYFGLPVGKQFTVGLAVISNFFNRGIEDSSILRYVQSSNNVTDIDIEPGIGLKLTDKIALGASFTASHGKFTMEPITGIPSLNIPDSLSRNVSSAIGYGGDAGILIKPTESTLVGLNYRSLVSYPMHGSSNFAGILTSNNYGFKFWTPARIVLSANQLITKKFGMVATIERIEWSVFKYSHIHGIATQVNSRPVILPNISVNYFLHDTWLFTLGGYYRITPDWNIRFATTYNQSPANGNYQISNGDSYVLGVAMSYMLTQNIKLDGSYAHGFIQDKNIHVTTGRNLIAGVNKGSRDAVSAKLTFNL